MLSFFLNPLTMIAGALLVSAPIIIHLINRMRFRRVKWAAMEFLLKAQKRMRRKMIIEQLILLFLRCFLIFLLGLLFARFLGFDPLAGKETRPTVHIVILDDSPSMADKGRAEGVDTDAFTEARRQITDRILPAALEATTAQSIRILRLSDQADVLNAGPDPAKDEGPRKINAELIEFARGQLGQQKVSTVRTSLVVALAKASAELDKAGGSTDTAKVIHIVTDLRAVDWQEDGEALSKAIRELNEAGVKVHFLDVSMPARPTDKSKPLPFSDNVGIVEFKPRTRIASENEAVDFEVRLKNFGSTDLKDVQVYFYRDGVGHIIQELPFPSLPAGQERRAVAQVTFQREDEPKDRTLTKEQLDKELKQRFHLVTAVVAAPGADGLTADNTRHAVIEVRKKLSVLIIPGPDEDVTKEPQKVNDSFYLQTLLLSPKHFRGISVVAAREDALDKHNLRQYSTIFLINVPRLTESQVKNLERYIAEGGGVGVFLGPKVDPVAYNNLLYRDGAGFFPAPLALEPTKPLTEDDKRARTFTLSKQILLRDSSVKTHPALGGLYTNERGDLEKGRDIERFFLFPRIEQHWPISRLGKWREDRSVQEIFCLPNDSPLALMEPRVDALIKAVHARYGEPKFEKYRAAVDEQFTKIRSLFVAEGTPMTTLAREIDKLLADQINEGDANEALFREFWGQPELAEPRGMGQALRDSCKYGDPLYLARTFRNGRVAVMTTDAGGTPGGTSATGPPWTDWPSTASWAMVMEEVQKYLAGGGAEENRVVGSTMTVSLEPGRYAATVGRAFLSADTAPSKSDRGQAPIIRDDLGDQQLTTSSNALELSFRDTRPGAYIFTLQPTPGDDQKAKPPEFLATIFNIDTAREGPLQRAKGTDLDDQAKGAEIHSSDDTGWLDTLKQKQTDLSSGRWIYLLILLVLVCEQAMAVRLSHHQRPEDLEAFAPSAAAAFAHGTPPPAAETTAAESGNAG
jgi:aerotolerance regulator-like protein